MVEDCESDVFQTRIHGEERQNAEKRKAFEGEIDGRGGNDPMIGILVFECETQSGKGETTRNSGSFSFVIEISICLGTFLGWILDGGKVDPTFFKLLSLKSL